MYLEHYALTDFPFQLTPDHAFFFDSRPHRKGMAYLTYGLSKGEGFIVITGEIGSGKTTLINYLISTIVGRNMVISHVVNTRMQADDLLRRVASGFAIAGDHANKAVLLGAVETFLLNNYRTGRRALLIVDEAQNLTSSALEELRLLSNLQMAGRPLLQICLSGQPEFRKTLADPMMEPFRQRIIASYHLCPLDADDARGYIEHRLRRVGWSGNSGFDEATFQAIHEQTGGVPRKINFLCDRLLLFGCLEDKRQFRAEDVKSVAAEMEEETIELAPSATVAAAQQQESAQFSSESPAAALDLALVAQHLAFIEQLLASTLAAQGHERHQNMAFPTEGEEREGQVQDLMQHMAQLKKRLG